MLKDLVVEDVSKKAGFYISTSRSPALFTWGMSYFFCLFVCLFFSQWFKKLDIIFDVSSRVWRWQKCFLFILIICSSSLFAMWLYIICNWSLRFTLSFNNGKVANWSISIAKNRIVIMITLVSMWSNSEWCHYVYKQASAIGFYWDR